MESLGGVHAKRKVVLNIFFVLKKYIVSQNLPTYIKRDFTFYINDGILWFQN